MKYLRVKIVEATEGSKTFYHLHFTIVQEFELGVCIISEEFHGGSDEKIMERIPDLPAIFPRNFSGKSVIFHPKPNHVIIKTPSHFTDYSLKLLVEDLFFKAPDGSNHLVFVVFRPPAPSLS